MVVVVFRIIIFSFNFSHLSAFLYMQVVFVYVSSLLILCCFSLFCFVVFALEDATSTCKSINP